VSRKVEDENEMVTIEGACYFAALAGRVKQVRVEAYRLQCQIA